MARPKFDRVNFLLSVQAADSILQLANRTGLTFPAIRQRVVKMRREGYDIRTPRAPFDQPVVYAKMVPINWYKGRRA